MTSLGWEHGKFNVWRKRKNFFTALRHGYTGVRFRFLEGNQCCRFIICRAKWFLPFTNYMLDCRSSAEECRAAEYQRVQVDGAFEHDGYVPVVVVTYCALIA